MAAIFPILFLFSQNVFEVDVSETVFPLFINLLITLILLLIVNYFTKDILKSAMMVTTFMLFFFSYGHFLNLAIYFDFSISENYNLVVFPILIIVLSLILFFIIKSKKSKKSKKNIKKFSYFLSIIFVLLISFQIINAGYTVLQGSDTIPTKPSSELEINKDVLKGIYDLDNSDFIDELRKRGFFVADSGHSNYCATLQSLISAFNLDYVHRLAKFDPNSFDRAPMAQMLANNRVFDFLKKYDYKTVSFESGMRFTELKTADYYFSPEISISEFQNFLLNLTPVPFFIESGKNQFDLHRDRVEYTFDKLGRLDNIKGPKFVFAPILSPHPPFIFDENGEDVQRNWPFSYADGDHYNIQGGTDKEYINGYRKQNIYISKRVLETVDNIIENSNEPPVIILQGDHGPGSGLFWENGTKTNLYERFSILNAYYLPGIENNPLFHSITPVNSFRLILNSYFGTKLEMLSNFNYYTTRTRPYRFYDITEQLQEDIKRKSN